MNMMIKCVMLAALGLMAAALVGCGGGGKQFGQYDLTVQLDPELRSQATPPNIAVHVVGVPETELARWDALSVTDYWMPGSTIRSGAPDQTRAVNFGPGSVDPVVIRKSDPIWASWSARKSAALYVVASLPGFSGAPGNDPRLYRIPLETSNWPEDQKLSVTIRRTQVWLDTQPQPKAK